MKPKILGDNEFLRDTHQLLRLYESYNPVEVWGVVRQIIEGILHNEMQ